MSIRLISKIRCLKNAPLNLFFSSRGPKCAHGELDTKPTEKAIQHYELCDTGPMTPLKQKQMQFQEDNGLPVHLKGGIKDRMLMNLTFALCGVGLLSVLKLFGDMMFLPNAGVTENQKDEKTEDETQTDED